MESSVNLPVVWHESSENIDPVGRAQNKASSTSPGGVSIVEQNHQRCWDLPPKLEQWVSKKCPEGLYLVCSVCSEYDVDRHRFATVKSRNPFWRANFQDHVNSKRHKDNFIKKKHFEDENQRRKERNQPPRKKLKQAPLPFFLGKLTKDQVFNRLVGGVDPSLAEIQNFNTNIDSKIRTCDNPRSRVITAASDQKTLSQSSSCSKSTERTASKVWNSMTIPSGTCRGMIANKDLTDDMIQNALRLMKKYFLVVDEKELSTIKSVGDKPILSLFHVDCTVNEGVK